MINTKSHPYQYAVERIIRKFNIDITEVPIELLQKSTEAESKLKSCLILYDGLCATTGKTLPWGIFTGVHPIRFIRENYDIINEFKIAEDKLLLAKEIISAQESVLPASLNTFSLYIGIPFCPSRCKYCNFVSESVAKSHKLIPEYTKLLIKELYMLGEYAREQGLLLETVYIGGGTPTALPVEDQAKLYDCVASAFDASRVKEYTIEAGRPETLAAEVLQTIKQSGATRISINPQSMDDSVLQTIQRGHTVKDVTEAYNRVIKAWEKSGSLPAVNMDLIAGLPGESEHDFIAGLNKAIELNPSNITVHSLARKKGAALPGGAIGDYTSVAYNTLKQHGFTPYYMYKLSDSDGDNIGYTQNPKQMCLYNIYMMDESSVVLAAGCGGASRILGKRGETMKKHYNFKYPYEYINRFNEILNKFKGDLR